MFCLICNLPLPHKPENVNQENCEKEKEVFTFRNFCRYFNVKDLRTLGWDLTQEDHLPFCPCCSLVARKLAELNHQLELIQKELAQTETWVKSQITNISHRKPSLEDHTMNRNSASIGIIEDKRIQTLRDIIIGPCLKLNRIPIPACPANSIPRCSGQKSSETPGKQFGPSRESEDSEKEFFSQKISQKTKPKDLPEPIVEDMAVGSFCEVPSCISENEKDEATSSVFGIEDPEDHPGPQESKHSEKTKTGKDIKTTSNVRDKSSVPTCQTCGKELKSLKSLKDHIRFTHTEPNEECGLCGRRFRGRGELNRHMKAFHLQVRDFVCHICGKDFFLKTTLTRHLASASHSKNRRYKCDTCGEKFLQMYHLTNHKRHAHSK